MSRPVLARRSRPVSRLLWLMVSLAAVAAQACAGTVGDDVQPNAPPSNMAGAGGAVPAAGAGGGGAGGIFLPPDDSVVMASCSGAAANPIRRLTHREYLRSVRDLLADPAVSVEDFPADGLLGGFDNNAEALSVSTVMARRYLETAEAAASRLVNAPDRLAKIVGCSLGEAERARCLRQFVERFGRRAFRRPLEPREVDALVAVGQAVPAGAPAAMSVGQIVEAVLQSPKFLFRVEVARAHPTRAGVRLLTGYEVATRLAFFLTGTTPTDALLDLAGAGKLEIAAGAQEAARLLLTDGKAREAVQTFFGQWLGIAALDDVTRDPKRYPAWNDALRTAMAEETNRFVDDLVWTRNAGMLDLFTERTTMVNAPLGKLYGRAVTGTGWSKATLGPERAGILTHASFLTVTAGSSSTPIKRAKLIRSAFLCDAPPPPPSDIEPLDEPAPGQTVSVRASLEQHRKDPACQGCHTLLDPLGFGLERFDDIGGYRERDESGAALTGAGVLTGDPKPEFVGAAELGAKLKATPRVADCVSTHLFTYAFGRAPAAEDGCALERMRAAFRTSNGSFQSMLLALVGSESFLTTGGTR